MVCDYWIFNNQGVSLDFQMARTSIIYSVRSRHASFRNDAQFQHSKFVLYNGFGGLDIRDMQRQCIYASHALPHRDPVNLQGKKVKFIVPLPKQRSQWQGIIQLVIFLRETKA